MKLRKITIKTINDKIYSWNLLDIKAIEFNNNWIRINSGYIERKDFYYSYWRYFIEQLTRVFDIKEFEIEK